MTTGHRPKTKGYTVKIIDGKPTLVRKITFRKSIAQHKADRTVQRYTRKTPTGGCLPGLYPGKKS
jgi:hypothetical protein